MEPPDVERAIAAAASIAGSFGLPTDDAVVLQNSNRLAVHLTPCDVVARVAHLGHEAAPFEVELACRLTHVGAPVGGIEPRAEPILHRSDGFVVSLWSYHEPIGKGPSPSSYAKALAQLHAGMRTLEDVSSPPFTDRIAEAEDLLANPDLSPDLVVDDREFLMATLGDLRESIAGRGAPEQLLHGEPHAGNVLTTVGGLLFIDFETCCRGPVEFDLAHVPEAVCDHYPGIDRGLLDDCRQLVLAMVAAWRWELGDEFPNGRWFGEEFLRSLRAGPPWPTLDAVTSRLET